MRRTANIPSSDDEESDDEERIPGFRDLQKLVRRKGCNHGSAAVVEHEHSL